MKHRSRDSAQGSGKIIPRYEARLRKHILQVPPVIRECSGIVIFGRRIKSVAFTTDLCIVRNMDADAVLAVYPFTPQPVIIQALLLAADIPVFAGVGGGLTQGKRVCTLAGYAELQGAAGVVMNAPTGNDVLRQVSHLVDIPTIITIVNDRTDFRARAEAGADIFNVAAGVDTPELVRKIRRELPEFPLIATGGPTEESILETIRAGANAISWTPPPTASLFKESMAAYREGCYTMDDLIGRSCYGGLDLSSTSDLTALVLVFPPTTEDAYYRVLPFFWLPEETIPLRVRRDHVPYDVWQRQGIIQTTEGDVVHYGFIEQFIVNLGKMFIIREIAVDRWNASMMVQALQDDGFTIVRFGQGFRDMSNPTKDLMRLVLDGSLKHDGHPILRWCMDNVYVRTDPAGNIKPDKEKSTEKIDGVVALVMALDRAQCHLNDGSVYDDRGLMTLDW